MIEMIQLIAGSKAFHFAISKMIVSVQEANSPYSLNEIALLNEIEKFFNNINHFWMFLSNRIV